MSAEPSEQSPEWPSFVAILRSRAESPGAAGGFAFLDDGEPPGAESWTFEALDARARAVAARLQAGGLRGDHRALLVYPPGLDFLAGFFGCLYAGVVAVPAPPPRPRRPSPRLRGIVADAGPAAILTTSALLGDVDRWGVPDLAASARIATDAIPLDRADGWRDPGLDRDAMAFLQYTSGSTAEPKGVVVTHGNLLANSAAIGHCFGSTSESRGVFWLPLHHDMGLIGGVLQTIHCGGFSTLMAPASFLQRPIRWLEAISRTGATISGGPDFAYDLCARKVTAEQKAGLDLSHWAVAFDGAEPIRADTLDRFAEAFAPCGFRREAFLPCYGLAESTLLVTGGRAVVFDLRASSLERGEAVIEPGGEKARRLVGSGRVAPGHAVAIVAPESGRRLPDGRVGEVRVSGPSVANGYWGRPDASAEVFGATVEGVPFLKTGDLGFLRDGELIVTGRLKDLMIVRGRNVYPQDVEATVERCHPALEPGAGAAFAVGVGGVERLVVVVEAARRAVDVGSALGAIRSAVAAEHDLDLHAVAILKPTTLPRTSSGKVRRGAAREAFEAGALDVVASWTEGSVVPEVEAGATPSRTSAEVAAWLASALAGPLGIAPEEVDPRRPFASFGLGSLRAVELAGELERWLGRPLAPTLLYDHPTIEALARSLGDGPRVAEPIAPTRPVDDRIAIVGIGCRFPGADGPEAFWRLLAEGRDAVGPVPEGRRGDFDAPESTRGGFLDRVDGFDADFFGIAPRESAQVDPQQRLLLEVAWEALEDAGQAPDRLAGGRVGVFVGVATNDYGRMLGDSAEGHALTGNASSIAANRISYAFDFRGPSLAVDSACSSSLVAVHLACRSLAGGESDLALAGGVNLILAPDLLARFEAAGFLASDGRCKAFDARADGYVRGEGCGLVVLKPLAKALADGDPIRAVIRGGAVNQDGRSNGLSAPSREAQEAVLRDAYRSAGVDPSGVAYVEAHGTGTMLGDPIEAHALGAVVGSGRGAGRRLAIGSAKTNIGHLEAAAGVAGLIKVAMAMEHGSIPPSLHFESPSPRIPFDALGLEVVRESAPWPEGPRLAGVSSFGFGGTNAHLVVEGFEASDPAGAPAWDVHLLPISARSPGALAELARAYREALAAGGALDEVAGASGARRSHHDHRLAVVAGSAEEAVEGLDAFARGEGRSGLASGRRVPGRPLKVAFVFSGQGVQWPGMGLDLLRDEPAFRSAFEGVDRLVLECAGWSPLAELSAEPSRLADPEFAQPTQLAVQVALSALWRSWGVVPDAVIGHSLGEIAAAHESGALGLADAARLAVLRGRATRRVDGRGRTVAVGLGPDEAASLAAGSGGRLALAAVNGPDSATLSGDPEAVADLVARLQAGGTFARVLGGAVAFHGPMMDGPRAELERALDRLKPRSAAIPMVSTVTGDVIDGAGLDAPYWGRNLRDTVRFADAAGRLVDEGYDVFLELGPHPALSASVAAILRDRGRDGLALGSIRRGRGGSGDLLRSLAALYARGLDVDWMAVTPGARPSPLLPRYPWQRERHWAVGLAVAPKVVEPEASTIDIGGLISAVRWEEASPLAGGNGDPGHWRVVGGSSFARAVAGRLELAGARVSGDDSGPIRGVVDLSALDLPDSEGPTLAAIESACVGAWDRARGLASRVSGRLWVVTLGAQPAGGAVGNPAQAALWGLGRSIGLEFPGAWGGLIDLDPTDPIGGVGAMVGMLLHPDGEDQVAFREGRRLVARLAPVESPDGGAADRPIDLAPKADGTYLVTGGLGELGLKVARWLVDRGARRLVLVGRRGLPGRSGWEALAGDGRVGAIRAMEAIGATVVVAPGDVADAEAMAALFDHLAAELPPIRGIVHAAGSVGGLGVDDFGAAFRAKVGGAGVLLGLARSLPLDFFVGFSSVAGLLGAKEAAYAAANRALDALIHRAIGRGIPALGVGWGPWAGGGMASDRLEGQGKIGLGPIDPDRALAALEAIGRAGLGHAVVARADWPLLRSLMGRAGSGRFLERMGDEVASKPSRRSAVGGDWRGMGPEARREALVGYFRGRLAEVLRLDPGRVDPDRPLDTLGLDSLTAIELKGGVEADLGLELPIASLFGGPTARALADWAAERWSGADGAESAPIEAQSADVEDHPASPGQRSLWVLHRRMPADPAYNMAGAARIGGDLDVAALRRSIQVLVDRHASLRTTFPEVEGAPVQRVHARALAHFEVVDASGRSDLEVQSALAEEARRPFDLESGPPFRTTLLARPGVDHHVVLAIHHAVGDFWSIALLLDELGRIYPAERLGVAAELPPIRLRYVDFAARQAEMLAGPEGDRLRAYWGNQLAGPPPPLDLPTDRPRPSVRSHRGATRSARVGAELTRRVAAVGSARGSSLYVTLLAAFQVLLGRLAGVEDVVVGSPVAGRDRAGLAEVVGYFANPLPIRSKLAGDPTFGEFLARVRRTVFDGWEHQGLPFAEMAERFADRRDPSRSPLFQAMFAYQKAQRLDAEGLTPFVLRADGARLDLGGAALESVGVDLGSSQFELTLAAAEVDGGLATTIEWNTDLFDPATIDRFQGRFLALLESIADGPDRRLSELAILAEGEREAVVDLPNATDDPYPDVPLHLQIEAQAARTPEAVAVASGADRLTYRELDQRSNRLARHLRGLGVGPESRVGLLVDRSVGMVVGLLGILKAGGAYVPLDPEYPAGRLAYLAGDSGINALVTQGRLADRMPDVGAVVVRLDADRDAIDRHESGPVEGGSGPDQLAYVIYTSGSTGKPKGVAVTHRNLAVSTHARAIHYREPVGALLLVSSVAHDTSVAGLFWALSQGGCLVVPGPGEHLDPDRLTSLVAEHRVTHWLSVPSLLRVILADGAWGRLGSIATAIVAGESCPRDLPALVRDRLAGAGLHNEYGPTEATVWCTVHECRPEDGDGPAPIGRPIANARVYLLDGSMRPSPIGVAGELYVGGLGVARGYLDRPGLTADRFVPDPFATDAGARLYRTGDLARWRADGAIDFLGRVDGQVKVRGHRIEPGEVESTLADHPSVREALAVAVGGESADARLVAYFVPANGSVPAASDLRRWMKGRVPDALVPSAFVPIAALPVSPNGKLDRSALPDPSAVVAEGAGEGPRDEAEAALARIAADLLGRERVGILEDFFDLGIDSIRAIQLVARARQAGWALDPGQVFEHPTVAGLAAVAAPAGLVGEPESGPAEVEVEVEVEEDYPLSPMQEAMLHHSRLDPGSGVYVQQFACSIEGEVRVDAFEDAWRRVIARHPALRTSFEGLDSGRGRQSVRRRVDLPIRHLDWRGAGPREVEIRLARWLRDNRGQGFDPADPPLLRLALIRVGEAAHRLVLSNHHALMDGWCAPIVLGEVVECYEAALDGREPALAPARPYRAFIDWLGARDPAGSDAYWRRELGNVREATPIPIPRGDAGAIDPGERRLRLSKGETSALRAMARAHRVTVGTVIQGAWALLLGRYSGRDEVVFGVTVSGRPAELAGVESMIGLFINTLPARVELPDEAPLADWLAELQIGLIELRRHQATPLARARSSSGVPRSRPLFESVMIFEDAPGAVGALGRAGRLGVGEVRVFERTNFPMAITASPGDRLVLTANFDADRFDGDAVGSMVGHLANLIRSMASAGPDARLADLAMAPESDKAGLDGLTDAEVDAMLSELSNEEEAIRHE